MARGALFDPSIAIVGWVGGGAGWAVDPVARVCAPKLCWAPLMLGLMGVVWQPLPDRVGASVQSLSLPSPITPTTTHVCTYLRN